MNETTPAVTPLLSVVLITDRLATVRRVLDHLARQTRADCMEVVIAHPASVSIDLRTNSTNNEYERIGIVRLVPVPSVMPMSDARAAAARSATAPLVFLGETHSFAQPTFAAELINAFDGSADVLVPGLGNANPKSVLSWAAFMYDYGTWLHMQPAGFIGGGPTWNSAYSRETLVDVDDVLEIALSHGTLFAERMRAAHRRVRFVPSARLDHANVATGRSWVYERYLSGLLVAAQRRTNWSFGKRVAYVVASPLIPVVTLTRLRHALAVARRDNLLPAGTLVALVAAALIRTVGEVVGYVMTPSPQREIDMEDNFEMNKLRHVGQALE